MADFDVYFADKVKQLKIHSAELDGEQQQAVAAVNRLEKQIGVFNEMIASLEKDTNAVHDIHEKISKYGNQITDLSKMTSAVEENLLKIKNESNFVGKVHDKLEESKSDIEKIKKQIPLISQEFQKTNAEQLKVIGADLLKKYDARVKDIENSTKGAVNQYEEVMNKINSDVAGIYQQYAFYYERFLSKK